jgi:hypothetical protein
MKSKVYNRIQNKQDKSILSLNALFAEEIGDYAKLPVPSPQYKPTALMYSTNDLFPQPFYKHTSRLITNNYDDK